MIKWFIKKLKYTGIKEEKKFMKLQVTIKKISLQRKISN